LVIPVTIGDTTKVRASRYMSGERGGAGECVPFIQQRRKVEIAGILNLSSGGRSETSTLAADGRSRYPAKRDQIAAASTGNTTNRMTQIPGQANNAK
jgi:hypothetical protein